MGEAIEVDGLKIEIDADALNDMELLLALSELKARKLEALAVVQTHLFKEGQQAEIMNHLRGENGKVSVEAYCDFILKVFESVNSLKKS